MLSLITSALAAGDAANVSTTAIEVNWSIVSPFVIFALGNICALAYMFGLTNQKIRAIDRDVERVRVDVERIHEQNRDTDQRIHDMALVLSKIDTRLDVFLSAAGDTSTCPFFRANLVRGKRASDAEVVHDDH